MKKHILTLFAIFFLWISLSWCTDKTITKNNLDTTWATITGNSTWSAISGDSAENESVVYLSWYTWNTITVTNDISGAIITQTTDTLLYKNEVYGFQLLLTQKAKGVKIKDWILLQSGNNGTTISSHYISLYWDDKSLLWQNWYDQTSSLNHEYANFQRIIDIQIMDHNYYNSITDWMFPWTGRKPLEEVTLWHNNKYYFVLGRTNATDDYLAQLIPTLTCKDTIVQTTKEKNCRDCGRQLITWFKTFDFK